MQHLCKACGEVLPPQNKSGYHAKCRKYDPEYRQKEKTRKLKRKRDRR